MAIEILKNLADLTRQALSVKHEIGVGRDKLVARISALQAERKRLLTEPLSRADLEAVIRHDILAAGQEALRDQGDILRALEEARDRPAGRVEDPANCANYNPLPHKPDGYLLALLLGPDTVLTAVKPLLDKMSFGAGKPLPERRTRLAAIDQELAALAKQKAELDAALAEPAPQPEKKGPKLGDTMEKIGADGKAYLGTFCNPTGFGAGGWLWREKEAA